MSWGDRVRLATTHPMMCSVSPLLYGDSPDLVSKTGRHHHGGTWHIGVMAAPGIPEMLLAAANAKFLGQFAFPAMSATPGAITHDDIDEFVRTYSRLDGCVERLASISQCCRRVTKSRRSPRLTG